MNFERLKQTEQQRRANKSQQTEKNKVSSFDRQQILSHSAPEQKKQPNEPIKPRINAMVLNPFSSMGQLVIPKDVNPRLKELALPGQVRGFFSATFYDTDPTQQNKKISKTSINPGTTIFYKPVNANKDILKVQIMQQGQQAKIGYMYAGDIDQTEYFKPIKDPNFKLFKHRPILSDVKQYAYGDCFLLGTLSAILDRVDGDQIIQSMMRQEGSTVVVRFYHPTEKENNLPKPVYIRVNIAEHMVPTKNGIKSTFSHQAPWVSVLEQAYAATGWKTYVVANKPQPHLKNNVEFSMNHLPSLEYTLEGGSSKAIFSILTGNKATQHEFLQSEEGLRNLIQPGPALLVSQNKLVFDQKIMPLIQDIDKNDPADETWKMLQKNFPVCQALSKQEVKQWDRYIDDLKDQSPTAYQQLQKALKIKTEAPLSKAEWQNKLKNLSGGMEKKDQPPANIIQRFIKFLDGPDDKVSYINAKSKQLQQEQAYQFCDLTQAKKPQYTKRQLTIYYGIYDAIKNKAQAVTTGTIRNERLPKDNLFEKKILHPLHCYHVINVKEGRDDQKKYIELRNPHGGDNALVKIELSEFEQYFNRWYECDPWPIHYQSHCEAIDLNASEHGSKKQSPTNGVGVFDAKPSSKTGSTEDVKNTLHASLQ